MEDRKLAMITGLHGNGNIGGDDLNKAVKSLDENFDRAVARLYGADIDEEDIDLSENPFFAAMKLPEIEGEKPKRLVEGKFEVEIDE